MVRKYSRNTLGFQLGLLSFCLGVFRCFDFDTVLLGPFKTVLVILSYPFGPGHESYPGLVGRPGNQLLDAVSCRRIAQIGGNFLEGNQYKISLRPVRMRDGKPGLIDDPLIIKNDITMKINLFFNIFFYYIINF